MKIIIVISFVATTLSSVNSISSNKIDDQEWTSFKTRFNKIYNDDNEESYRKKLYFENKSKIAEHNNKYENDHNTYKMEINSFADLINPDFVSKINKYEISNGKNDNSDTVTISTSKNVAIPDAVDWRSKGYDTPVKNEGRCRSDWAISAVETIQAQYFKKTQKLISLSVQNVIDCLKGNDGVSLGCDGGMAEYAFEYIKENKGIDTEESYPYQGQVEECRYNSNDSGITIKGYTNLSYGNETELMETVATFGPVSVGIDVSAEFRLYTSGVYYDPDWNHWSPRYTNHAMLVVGYGTDKKQGDYWIVKNSWGEGWGDKGYVFIARNKGNNCGIASLARIPLL